MPIATSRSHRDGDDHDPAASDHPPPRWLDRHRCLSPERPDGAPCRHDGLLQERGQAACRCGSRDDRAVRGLAARRHGRARREHRADRHQPHALIDAPTTRKRAMIRARARKTPARELVIALHCSGAGAAQWRRLGETLGEDYELVAPEHYGCDRTGPWTGDHAFTLADEAARTIALIDGNDRKVHLVGHSYGGGVALH